MHKNINYKFCNLRHIESICYTWNYSIENEKKSNKNTLLTESKSEVISTVSHTGKKKFFYRHIMLKSKMRKNEWREFPAKIFQTNLNAFRIKNYQR